MSQFSRHSQSQRPSTSRHSRRRQDNSVEEMEESQSTQKKKKLTQAELDPLVASVIYYILRANEGKTHIQKANIQKNVLAKTKHYGEVMTEVRKRFENVFGYKLVEFDSGKYILANSIANVVPHINLTKEEKKKQVLLFLVLSHIFMNEDSCQEDNLYMFLNDLGISTSEVNTDPYFGNVRQIINDVRFQEFVQQRYLDRLKNYHENEWFEYKWGIRAENELSLRKVLEFVQEVYNTPMESFKKQHNRMIQREKLDNERNLLSAPPEEA